MELHRSTEAETDLRLYDTIAPNDPSVWRNIAGACWGQKKFSEALEAIDVAIGHPKTSREEHLEYYKFKFQICDRISQIEKMEEVADIFVSRFGIQLNWNLFIDFYRLKGDRARSETVQRRFLKEASVLNGAAAGKYSAIISIYPAAPTDLLESALEMAMELEGIGKVEHNQRLLKRYIGFLQYRLGMFAEAEVTLEDQKAMEATDPFYILLFYQSMIQAKLNRVESASKLFDQAVESANESLNKESTSWLESERRRELREESQKVLDSAAPTAK